MKKNVAVFAAVLGLSLSTVSGAFAQGLDTENPIKIGYVGALSGDTALWGTGRIKRHGADRKADQ